MRFCPKCGNLMMPIRKEDKIILKCTNCGFEEESSVTVVKEYRVTASIPAESRVITTSVVSEATGKKLRRKEEYEQEREEYYEIALELLQEELEGVEREEE